MKHLATVIIVATLGLATTTSVHGFVVPASGAYKLIQVDAALTAADDTKSVKVERVYNSQNQLSGMFGKGWSSPWERTAQLSDDGGVVDRESNTEQPRWYYPEPFSRAGIDALADNIEKLPPSLRGELAGKSSEEIQMQLKNNAALRYDLWQKLVEHGVAQAPQVAVGTRFYGTCGRAPYYEWTGKGLVLVNSDDSRTEFDAEGHVATITFKDNRQVVLQRNTQGLIERILDPWGRELRFTYDDNGRMIAIESDAGETVSYEYDAAGRLIAAKNKATGVVEHYAYNKTDQLIEERTARYTKAISYYPDGNVSEVREGKLVTEYSYRSEPMSQWGLLEQKLVFVHQLHGVGGATPTWNITLHRYTIALDLYGDKWISNAVNESGGNVTETEYASKCLPLWQKVNEKLMFSREFDGLCRLTYQEKDNEQTWISYEGDTEFASTMTTGNRVTGSVKTIQLAYNENHKVAQVSETEGRTASSAGKSADDIEKITYIEYSEFGKPSLIRKKGEGELRVYYNDKGEIEKVDSKGEGIALVYRLADIMRQISGTSSHGGY